MSQFTGEAPPAAKDIFGPTREDYANFHVPVQDSFRWQRILVTLGVPVSTYVAVYAFRSILKADADVDRLEALDEKAFLAAEQSPGFIHYEPNEGLSYCIWESYAAAEAGVTAEAHRAAVKIAPFVYEDWDLKQWMVAHSADGTVEFIAPN